MVKLNIVNNGLVEVPFDENLPTIEVTEEQFEQIKNGKLRYENGKLVDNTDTINAYNRIVEIKPLLQKYKEDVEQVELFGMERTDYEEKKKACADMILELRELEKTLKSSN